MLPLYRLELFYSGDAAIVNGKDIEAKPTSTWKLLYSGAAHFFHVTFENGRPYGVCDLTKNNNVDLMFR